MPIELILAILLAMKAAKFIHASSAKTKKLLYAKITAHSYFQKTTYYAYVSVFRNVENVKNGLKTLIILQKASFFMFEMIFSCCLNKIRITTDFLYYGKQE